MARVNHLKLKQLVYAGNDKYTDKDFFLSKQLAAYLQDILDAISCAYTSKKIVRIKVVWDEAKNAQIGCTDNKTLMLNAGHEILKNLNRAERFESLLGLLLHETGHIMFTNFSKTVEVVNQMMLCRLIMIPDEKYEDAYEAYEKVRDYLMTIRNPQIKSIIISIWKSLVNALEDGHIDVRIGERYPGYKPYLDFLNDLCFNLAPTVAEIKTARKKLEVENPDEPVCLIYDFLQYLLSYSNYGFLKGEEWEIKKDEAAMKIYDLIDWIDLSKETNNSIERMLYQNIVFYKSFPFEYIDALLLKYGNEDHSTVDNKSLEQLNNALSQTNQVAGSTSASSQSSLSSLLSGGMPMPAGDEPSSSNGANGTEAKGSGAKGTPSQAQGMQGSNSQGASISSEGTGDGSEENPLSNSSVMDSSKGDDESESETETGESNGNSNDGSEEQGNEAPNICSNSLMNSKSEQKLEDALNEMESILEKMKKDDTLRAKEQHLENELNTFAASIKHSSIHNGYDADITRIDSPDEELKEAYNKIWPELAPISKKLVGRLEKEMEKQRKGYKQKNLYYGKRLEASAVIRGDGKYFSRKNLPSGKKRLSVGLLVDESGSMSSVGRIHHARLTSLILYDFCRRLDIPIAVYGHTTRGSKVLLNAYAEFDSVDKNDKYRIMQMEASGCNRDGYALRYMAERLMMQNTEMKLLFIISDGKPNHYGYNDDNAYEDLSSIKREYHNKNIITIAAAIGDDKKTIEHIYGTEAFLDVTNLNELPQNLVAIIKGYL